MTDFYIDLPVEGGGIPSVPSAADLPPVGSAGQTFIAVDTGAIYGWSVTSNAWETGGTGSGTVSSVAMTVPSILAVSGSPITTTGTLALSLSTQSANRVLSGPTTGSAATPTFRSLVPPDLTLTSAHIIVGDGSNLGSSVAMSGDVGISNTGVTAIGSNKVANSQLAQMSTLTLKGNASGSTANAADLTVIQANTLLTQAVYNAGNSSTAITINWNNGPWQQVTLTGNCTVTLSNAVSGAVYVLEFVQGSGSYTVTFSGVKWPGGSAYSATATNGAIDQVNLGYNGLTTSYRGTFALAYA